MISKQIKITIIGGGIGGLVTAIALHKKGFNPIVFEKATALKPIGAGIVLSTNAMNALSKIGLSDEVLSLGAPVNTFQLQDHKENALNTTDFDYLGEKYGYPAVGISRSDLQKILFQALPEESVRLGYEFNSLEKQERSLLIKFEGKESIKSDIVIGVDGLNSKVRTDLFGNTNLRYSGQAGWRGLGPLPKQVKLDQFFESWGPGQRFGAVKINAKQVYWYVGINAPTRTLSNSGTKSKKKILSLFKGWHDPIQELIQETSSKDIIQTDIFDSKPISQWYSNNVILLGDAVHPTTPNLGQGAGMAIESALILANCLSSKDTVSDAFFNYQALRKNRTKWVTSQSWLWGKLSQINSPLACYLRNKSMIFSGNIAPKFIEENQIKKLLGYQVEF
ncbi:NAD(P)-binding protein [bacterium]|jgi:2-polyprenyl-6-methoxyphenol hydroxylase-like FAD-dependent oxidoreductase|nr:NAD(P)-binding protein [bacterium]